MGTFSKTFAVTGGFIAGPKPVIDYLRYFARSYMFSASLSPVVVATVLAGLDVLEQEPERLWHLRQNVAYAAACLNRIGFAVQPETAIIPLHRTGMDGHPPGIAALPRAGHVREFHRVPRGPGLAAALPDQHHGNTHR